MNLIILYIMSAIINSTLIIKSPAFESNEYIPVKYTCDGMNLNPEIHIDNIPANTKSLAIIVDDPDAPGGTFCHWVMWDVPITKIIKEGSEPGIQGRNTFGKNRYMGPCPPGGPHHYHFKVYALDSKLDNLPSTTDENKLLNAMKNHIISSGELIGLYKR